jgi:hypothetical protein
MLVYTALRPPRPGYAVTAAPEIIPQACTIPLTVVTPYPPITALCKYATRYMRRHFLVSTEAKTR